MKSFEKYTSFGMPQPQRNYNPPTPYRWGFNGQEKVDEINGITGSHYTALFWEYDSRIGRRWDIDPMAYKFPWQSPYVAMDNNPVNIIDPTGQAGEDPQKYKVEKGNTLSGIAKEHKTTVDEILKMNPSIKDPNKIYTGQEINLPGSSPNSTSGTSTNTSSANTGNTTTPNQTNNTPTNHTTVPISTSNPQTQQAGLFGEGTEWVGPTLILAGQPINYLKPVGALGSKPGSSIASYTLSKAIPYSSTIIKKTTAAIVGKKASTAVLGRALGRLVPGVGWAITIYDIWTSDARKAMSAGAGDYYKMQRKAAESDPMMIVCFTKGTLVYTPNGLIPIEKIKIGDIVYSFNLDKNEIELGKVTNTLERNTGDIYKLTTEKEEIYVTAEHPFYVKSKGWMPVKELKVGFRLQTAEGEITEEIKTIESLHKYLIVYNIQVDGNNNYFVTSSDILVHNKYIDELEEFKESLKTKTESPKTTSNE